MTLLKHLEDLVNVLERQNEELKKEIMLLRQRLQNLENIKKDKKN